MIEIFNASKFATQKSANPKIWKFNKTWMINNVNVICAFRSITTQSLSKHQVIRKIFLAFYYVQYCLIFYYFWEESVKFNSLLMVSIMLFCNLFSLTKFYIGKSVTRISIKMK